MKKKYTLLLLFSCFLVNAQWSNNPSINTAVTTVNSTGDPIMTSDNQGGAILVWLDIRNGTNFDIYAQRINSQGLALWTNNGIAVCNSQGNKSFGDQESNVSLQPDGFGGAIVTWIDYRDGNDSPKIYTQKINSSGTTQWQNNGVLIRENLDNDDATDGLLNPNIASDSSGGAIITWTDQRNGFLNSRIYAQRVNNSGIIQWQENGIAITSEFISVLPKIVSDDQGGAIISWMDARNLIDIDVYAQRIDSSGAAQWQANGFPIFVTPNSEQFDIEMIKDDFGGAIIAWSDNRNGLDFGNYAQRINSTGQTLWATNGLKVSDTTNDQNFVKLAPDGLGGALFAWQDDRSDVSGDAYAQKISANGNILWQEDGIVICDFESSLSWQTSVNIVSDGLGGAIVIWSDGRGDFTNPYDFYGQRVSSNGTLLWNIEGAVISNNTESGQFYPVIVSNNINGAIISWYDDRDTPTGGMYGDIYMQNICGNGQLGNCVLSIKENTANNNISVFPNPTDSKLNIQLNDNQIIDKVIITDLSGKILIEQTQNNSQINVENLAFGLYIIEAFSNNNKFERKFIKY